MIIPAQWRCRAGKPAVLRLSNAKLGPGQQQLIGRGYLFVGTPSAMEHPVCAWGPGCASGYATKGCTAPHRKALAAWHFHCDCGLTLQEPAPGRSLADVEARPGFEPGMRGCRPRNLNPRSQWKMPRRKRTSCELRASFRARCVRHAMPEAHQYSERATPNFGGRRAINTIVKLTQCRS